MLNKLKIGQKLLLLVVVLSVLLIGVAAIGARGQQLTYASVRAVYEDRMVAMRLLGTSLERTHTRSSIERASQLGSREERRAALAPLVNSGIELDRSWRGYRATRMAPEERIVAERADGELSQLVLARQGLINAIVLGLPWKEHERQLLDAKDAYRKSLEQLVDIQDELAFEAYRDDQLRAERLLDIQIAGVVLSLLVGSILSWLIVRSITAPMGEAIKAARRIADGELDVSLPGGGSDETGQLLGALSQMKQVLSHTATENRDYLERLLAITEAVPVAVFQLRASERSGMRYLFVCSQVYELLGVTASEMMESPFNGWRHVVPMVADQLRGGLERVLCGDGSEVIDFAAPVLRGGAQRWVRMHARAARGADGLLTWSGYFADVTAQRADEMALRQAKAEAEEAVRVKSDFLANMSHEIRTPMNAILGMSHLALQTELGVRQRDYVTKIQGAGQHLLGIINDILDYSKMEAGKLSTETLDFDLEALLDNVSSLTAEKAAARGLELLFDVAPDVPTQLRGDPLRLGQVLINFTGNAIKFTSEGEVAVSVRLLEQADGQALLRFAVRDTGIGISPEQCATLFRSFSQADASTTRKYGGTGLGLAISRRLVEMMGGTVGIDSSLGKGSTFWFTVPLGMGEVRQRPYVRKLAGARALVVDDNASARQVSHELLAAMGVQAELAASGEQALAMVKTADAAGQAYQYVLVDWQMPGMDGMQTIRALQALRLREAAPAVLVASTSAREELHQQASALGVRSVLIKPINPSLLFNALCAQAGLPIERGAPVCVAPARELSRLRGAAVLLVEDNELNRQVMCELLAGIGLDVDSAENGAVALAKVGARDYDLVLMDVQMPVMDGLDATAAIRRAGHGQLPIVAMTANVMPEDRQRCMDAGMNAFLGKPVEPDSLWTVLLHWIAPRHGATAGAASISAAAAIADLGAGAAPAIAGVDTAAGLRRVRGNQASYLRMLRRFAGDHGEAAEKLRAALAGPDHAAAAALLHALRGVAGNIGAVELPPLALQLEQALREGAAARIQQAVAAFEDEFARLLAAISAALPLPEAAPAAIEVDGAELARVCARLAVLMGRNDAAAESLFREHQALLAGGLGSVCAQIGAALEQFDFEHALDMLRKAQQARAADAAMEAP